MPSDFGTTTSSVAVSPNSATINTPGLDDEEQYEAFKKEFGMVLADSAQYILRINDMDDARFCRWMGQSADNRKWSSNTGSKPFPWEGAADSRIWLIDETINDDVAIMMSAVKRGRMQAKPTNFMDAPYAQAVTIVLDYVLNHEMSMGGEWMRELEFAAQWRQHIGASVIQTDWMYETGTELKTITMQDIAQLAQQDPQFEGLLQFVVNNREHLSPQDIQLLGQMLQHIWPGITNPQEALLSLEKTGSYTFENPYIKQSRPQVFALAPFRDVFFPLNTWAVDRARWFVRRDLKNEVDLAEANQFENWDPEFYDQIKRLKGSSVLINYINSHRAQLRRNKDLFIDEFREMYEVFYAYYIQWIDGVRRVAVSPFHPSISVLGTKQLLPYQHGKLPFSVFRRDNSTRSIIESRGVADIAETAQNELKTQRDSMTDRTSFATIPPIVKPATRGKTKFALGPSSEVTEMRPGEVRFLEIPPLDQTTVAIQTSLRAEHDLYFGKENAQNGEDLQPRVQRTQQRLVDSFLAEVTDVVVQVGQLCQQFMGPDEWTQICHSKGTPFTAMSRQDIQKEFRLNFFFDARDLNMELMQQKLQAYQALAQMDQTGTIDKDALVRVSAYIIDPTTADAVLRPPQSVTQKEIDDTQNDLVKMAMGLQVPLPQGPVNANLRLQVLQSGLQFSQVMQQAFTQSPVAQQLLKAYVQTLKFQMQQSENAQIGRVGAAPVLPGPQPNSK